MDIKKLIINTLVKNGNVVETNEDTGIITVYTKENAMWDFTIPIEMKITPEQYSYLTKLRASGKTNMFDAGKYLVKEFNIDEDHAKTILMEWMNKFVNEDYRENV